MQMLILLLVFVAALGAGPLGGVMAALLLYGLAGPPWRRW